MKLSLTTAVMVSAITSQITTAFVVRPATTHQQQHISYTSRTTRITSRPETSLNVVENAGAVQEGELFPLAQEIFPGAVTYTEFLTYIADSLIQTGFDIPKTLLGTSLCCDELNRPLENLLRKIFDTNYSLGGMAGCPFGGVTSFRKMKLHIPDGGNCLVVYGAHTGINSQGQVGSAERVGCEGGGDMCCRSGILAADYVGRVFRGATPDSAPMDPFDMSQYYVQKMLLPHAERLENSENKMVELPYALYEGQLELLRRIIKEGSESGFPGSVAAFGGIQLNTPPGYVDYFVPLNGDLYGENGDISFSFF